MYFISFFLLINGTANSGIKVIYYLIIFCPYIKKPIVSLADDFGAESLAICLITSV